MTVFITRMVCHVQAAHGMDLMQQPRTPQQAWWWCAPSLLSC